MSLFGGGFFSNFLVFDVFSFDDLFLDFVVVDVVSSFVVVDVMNDFVVVVVNNDRFFNLDGFFNDFRFFNLSFGGLVLGVEGGFSIETFRSDDLDDLSLDGGVVTSKVSSQFSGGGSNSGGTDVVENGGEVDGEVSVGVGLVGMLGSEEEVGELGNSVRRDGSSFDDSFTFLLFRDGFSLSFQVESCNII